MNLKTGVNIHNKFEIEVVDALTGKIKQKETAYNMVLDAIWWYLVTFNPFFVNIHFGTGTGALAANRTSLFTHLGTKVAVDDTLIKAVPVSSWKRKIVLNPEEFVGSIITEVGIAFNSSTTSLVTHALLKDSEGNPISINKTSTDIVTIYATVFVTLATQAPNIKLVGLPSSNPLINYLIGGATFPNCYFYLGDNGNTALDQTNNAVEGLNARGVSPVIQLANWIKDSANKKVSTPAAPATRFGTTVGNGHIVEIGFGSAVGTPMLRTLLPISGIFEGQVYTAVPLGVGDGVKKIFELPSKNISEVGRVIKKDGVAAIDLVYESFSNSQNFLYRALPLPTYTDGSQITAVNNAFAMSSGDSGATIYCFEKINGRWVSRGGPSLGATANKNRAIALSGNGLVMAVHWFYQSQGLAYTSVFDWTGGTWIKRTDIPVSPYTTTVKLSVNYDGSIVAISTTDSSPKMAVYYWDGAVWVARNSGLSGAAAGKVHLSYTGDTVLFDLIDSPWFIVYDWNGTTWVARANPSVLPPSSQDSCLSANGLAVVVAINTSPYFEVYDWTGGVWIKRTTSTATATSFWNIWISEDGSVVGGCSNGSERLYVYDWRDGAWVKRTVSADVIPSPYNTTDNAMSRDGLYAVFAGFNSTGGVMIDLSKKQTRVIFDTPPAVGEAITADYTVNGIHKTDQYVIDVSFSIQFGEVV